LPELYIILLKLFHNILGFAGRQNPLRLYRYKANKPENTKALPCPPAHAVNMRIRLHRMKQSPLFLI